MVENSPKSSKLELLEQLQSLPLQDVPADLTDKVMARISSPKQSLIRAFWDVISRPLTISFRPIHAFGLAVVIMGSFFLGQVSKQNPMHITSTNESVPQIQPGAIENPQSAYMVGRGLLQADSNEAQALAFLQRAGLLEPQNPEFAYWEGVGHWANGDNEGERRSYLRGLEVEPRNIPLLINLGHNYLSDKNYQKALSAYQAVLALSPSDSVALYNSGLIYRALGKIPEEISSWRSYLQDNRLGTKAFRAVGRLNSYQDFSFRTYQFGPRRIIVHHQALIDESLPEDIRKAELAPLVSILEQDDRLRLEVVVFIDNDIGAARQRAFEIKNMIVQLSDKNIKEQIGLSWFDVPETIRIYEGTTSLELSEGLMIFSHIPITEIEEASI
jgi:tetratricopeptide (TPR) repeat protein